MDRFIVNVTYDYIKEENNLKSSMDRFIDYLADTSSYAKGKFKIQYG